MKKKYSKRQKGFESDKYRRQAKKRFHTTEGLLANNQPDRGPTTHCVVGRALASLGKRSHVGGRPAPLGLWPLGIPPTPWSAPPPPSRGFALKAQERVLD